MRWGLAWAASAKIADMIENQLYPTRAMARRLGVSPLWLEEEAAAGRLPSIKAGTTHLFNVRAVEAVLLQRAARRKDRQEAEHAD